MNLIRYILDFFHINRAGSQSVKYAKDHTYPATEETTAHVAAGYAEMIPVGETSADDVGAITEPAVAQPALEEPAATKPTPSEAPSTEPLAPAIQAPHG